MDYSLNHNFIDIYKNNPLVKNNNVIKYEFNIRNLINDKKKYIEFKYLKNTILIFKTNNNKLYYNYTHLTSGYGFDSNIDNNDIIMFHTDQLIKIYQDNEIIDDYNLDNLIIYEIKIKDKLNFIIKSSIQNYNDYIYYDSEIDSIIGGDYIKSNIYSNIDIKSITYSENFIEIYDKGYSSIIYKLIVKSKNDIIDKYIKIKSFNLILYYKVKKISQKNYEFILDRIYSKNFDEYYVCNFDDLSDYDSINNINDINDKINYNLKLIENLTDKEIEEANMTRPLDSIGKFTWYYNFNNILMKYKIYDDIIFYNLSWYNKYY